jgi:hypothetical protein
MIYKQMVDKNVNTSGKNNKAALAVQHSARHIFILKTNRPMMIYQFTAIETLLL